MKNWEGKRAKRGGKKSESSGRSCHEIRTLKHSLALLLGVLSVFVNVLLGHFLSFLLKRGKQETLFFLFPPRSRRSIPDLLFFFGLFLALLPLRGFKTRNEKLKTHSLSIYQARFKNQSENRNRKAKNVQSVQNVSSFHLQRPESASAASRARIHHEKPC